MQAQFYGQVSQSVSRNESEHPHTCTNAMVSIVGVIMVVGVSVSVSVGKDVSPSVLAQY